jgi:3-dehydro-L-gulonate 2-dehydrogenase
MQQRIPFEEMKVRLARVLRGTGMPPDRAELSARLFAEASLDGFYSHGLNRFPLFVEYIRQGYVDVLAVPTKIASFGVLERWDGHYGPGNLNARFSMGRAVELARQHGVGCVALGATNHWMRAGSYGWQAADAGCIGICWTNTMPNMPPWGAAESKVGNNPVVFAVPRKEGHLVLDIAMSQFSYGQLNNYLLRGDELPVDGGYDRSGSLTRDPGAILKTKRTLPIGFWKGSGLSIMLDVIAMLLAGGQSTLEIGKEPAERGLSQVFLAFDATKLPDAEGLAAKIEAVIRDLHEAAPAEGSDGARYPGEDTIRRREANLRDGIPVEPAIWGKVLELDAETV